MGGMFMPGVVAGMGEVDGAAVAGAVVIPGMGAIVFAGAGVGIGMPGIGAIVGWAATTGAVSDSVSAVKKAKRASNGNLGTETYYDT